MAKKILMALIASLVLQCGFGQRASAQAPCEKEFIWYWPDALDENATCTGPAQGEFSMICIGPTGNCPPPPPSVCPACDDQAARTGLPINLTTGNTYIQHADVRIPGLGGGLNLTRTWSSTWPSDQSSSQVGLFGSNWRSTYEERVFAASNYMVYVRGDGAFWFFQQAGSSWTLGSPARVTATLTQNGSLWILAFQNGEQRTFTVASGLLASVIDRNGNTTQIAWDMSSRITSVTDPASRHLSFSYANTNPQLITGISSDVGLSVSYSYDTQGRLSVVTEQDSSTLTFTYNSQSLITTVTDSQGKTLESHTYDSKGRGLTSARAGGVEAVTVTYPNE
jgi:YD repeat-containing protein